jgi:C4-dicarboxylate transporter DctM subunit
MKGTRWDAETDSKSSREGFSPLVYALAIFFFWMNLYYFVASEMEGVTNGSRAAIGAINTLD